MASNASVPSLWVIAFDPQLSIVPTWSSVLIPKHEAWFWSMLGYAVRHSTRHNIWIDPKYTILNTDFSERV